MTDRKTTPEADAGVVKLDDERAVMDVLARSVFGLWTVVNDLTRLRPAIVQIIREQHARWQSRQTTAGRG